MKAIVLDGKRKRLVIIHKDGTYELFERGYGLDRESLIAKLEKALGN